MPDVPLRLAAPLLLFGQRARYDAPERHQPGAVRRARARRDGHRVRLTRGAREEVVVAALDDMVVSVSGSARARNAPSRVASREEEKRAFLGHEINLRLLHG